MRSLWPKGGLWRHGDFLKLWSAETISQFGSTVDDIAFPLVAVLVLEASAFEVAALGSERFRVVTDLGEPILESAAIPVALEPPAPRVIDHWLKTPRRSPPKSGLS